MSKKMSLLFRRLFPCLLVFQVAFLCITMFAAEDTIQDGDVARQYTHMIAMWEAGTPFVPDWVYTTTMELDTAVFLALPFYAVTKDAVLSFCCANVVNILLWIALVFLLCHRVNRIASFYIDPCLASILVLIPYSTGSLYYWNMMFLNCSPYTLKVALPLLLIFLLLPPPPSQKNRLHFTLCLSVSPLSDLPLQRDLCGCHGDRSHPFGFCRIVAF